MTNLTTLQKSCNVGHKREISQWTNLLEEGMYPAPSSLSQQSSSPFKESVLLVSERVGKCIISMLLGRWYDTEKHSDLHSMTVFGVIKWPIIYLNPLGMRVLPLTHNHKI